ncbi:MAG TPA: GNAT family N-acetyltransferase [Bryobacteraceae bacterium]|nr:GNAT family N-acetyltransferase [Bryobacteraceae bacterium]
MNVRAVTLEDLAAIAEIQARSPEASQWDPASYLDYDCVVATDPHVVGFLVTRQTAPGEREILNLAVDPPQRRRGVARALLLAELGREKTQWFLEVRASNRGAIVLYQNAGFRVAGRRESYYSNPPEPGIVMKFDS